MRERSQEKGRDYQRATKKWLSRTRLLGYEIQEYGDAYDLTSQAAKIGNEYFDFSLKLVHADRVERILYAECKYRDENAGSIKKEFNNFLVSVYRALTSATSDEGSGAEFCFLSNVPPETWRNFIRNRPKFLDSLIRTSDLGSELRPRQDALNKACMKSHVLIISDVLIREY